MSLSLELLRLIGSPFVPASFDSIDDAVVLHEYSSRNRLGFSYLDRLFQIRDIPWLTRSYHEERTKCARTMEAILRISSLLTDLHIDHAVFKTIRPYVSTTVDIDIIIFGDKNNYASAIRTMQEARYKLVANGPRSTTFEDTKIDIGIDIYQQVAVSFITYIDKAKLAGHTTTSPINSRIRTLKPEADLACIIAHSLIKEQMYTLSEYYSFIHYLKNMDIDSFVSIIKENNLLTPARTHGTITAILHRAAHGTVPEGLQRILSYIGRENLETTRLIKDNFNTPHKYHPITIAKSIAEIAKGKETRRSIVSQLLHMLDLDMSRDFIRKLIDHVFRETY